MVGTCCSQSVIVDGKYNVRNIVFDQSPLENKEDFEMCTIPGLDLALLCIVTQKLGFTIYCYFLQWHLC